MRLSRLVLQAMSLSHEAGDQQANSLMVDMDDLFQRWIVQELDLRLAPDLRIERDEDVWLDEGRAVTMAPDLVVRRGSEVVLVGDAKYSMGADGYMASRDYLELIAYTTRHGPADRACSSTATATARRSPRSSSATPARASCAARSASTGRMPPCAVRSTRWPTWCASSLTPQRSSRSRPSIRVAPLSVVPRAEMPNPDVAAKQLVGDHAADLTTTLCSTDREAAGTHSSSGVESMGTIPSRHAQRTDTVRPTTRPAVS